MPTPSPSLSAFPTVRPTDGAPVLLVDDDEAYRTIFGVVLERAGYAVETATNGFDAIQRCAQHPYSLVTLDVDMPGFNGWQTLATLRERGCDTPVIMVTGAVAPEQRIRGLEGGADDYLCKPCESGEFLARVRAVLRRRKPVPAAPVVLHFGGTTVDLSARTAETAGRPLALTRTEYALLDLFAKHAGRLLSRELLLEAVWGYAGDANTRTVETHLWRLRKKLGDGGAAPRWLQTVPGGYRLTDEAVAACRTCAA